jgi:alanine dehydrogenase
MKLGIIKEGKTPPDKRVPLTPSQCRELEATFPNLNISVQTSDIRAIQDQEYRDAGIEVIDDVSHCDVLMGVKEVPMVNLVENKTYLFFSHTIKEQPYNQNLLQEILRKNIRLIDYECLTDQKGKRIIGFGRYAGIVGAYNGFLAYGLKSGKYALKPAHDCFDKKELISELAKINLADERIVVTGNGRVARGILEILEALNLQQVDPFSYLNHTYEKPVFTQLHPKDYCTRMDDKGFDLKEFYENPLLFQSSFKPYTQKSDILITGHYWDQNSPVFFTKDDMKDEKFTIKIVADVSCDIDGPIPCTLRPSTITEPLYGYDPKTESETSFENENSIGVMAVDNLPCELPRDASEDFGFELVNKVIPHFFNEDKDEVLKRATIAQNGDLGEYFAYLKSYAGR